MERSKAQGRSISILAPGRSLVKYYQPGWGDWVVAINRAAWLYEADWIAFTDKCILDGLPEHKLPRRGWVTGCSLKTPGKGLERIKPWIHGKVSTELGVEMLFGDVCCCNYTFADALAAVVAGQVVEEPEAINIYGADFGSGKDVADGGGNRSNKRYWRELAFVNHVAQQATVPIHWYCDMPDSVRRVLIDKARLSVIMEDYPMDEPKRDTMLERRRRG